jgi:hypothetical protein
MVQVEGELAKRTTRPLIVYTETLIESGRVRVDCISFDLNFNSLFEFPLGMCFSTPSEPRLDTKRALYTPPLPAGGGLGPWKRNVKNPMGLSTGP